MKAMNVVPAACEGADLLLRLDLLEVLVSRYALRLRDLRRVLRRPVEVDFP